MVNRASAARDGAEPAHSVRICGDDSEYWWSNRHSHGGYWREGRGWRDRDASEEPRQRAVKEHGGAPDPVAQAQPETKKD